MAEQTLTLPIEGPCLNLDLVLVRQDYFKLLLDLTLAGALIPGTNKKLWVTIKTQPTDSDVNALLQKTEANMTLTYPTHTAELVIGTDTWSALSITPEVDYYIDIQYSPVDPANHITLARGRIRFKTDITQARYVGAA